MIRGERLMMGRREVRQGHFFYSFDLDKVVPPDERIRVYSLSDQKERTTAAIDHA